MQVPLVRVFKKQKELDIGPVLNQCLGLFILTEAAGIELRRVATYAFAVRRANHTRDVLHHHTSRIVECQNFETPSVL